jgi:co-chaperonin GroES (HSP10)
MTSNIYLPEHISAMLAKETAPVEQQPTEERGRFLPDPVGYKMLLILPESEKEYESGILKADTTRQADEVASVVAFVAKQGPDCYKDTTKFPNGPWCKEGDFVVIRPYGGTRIVVHGKEMRLVNDDAIEAVVDDPRGIKRVGG